MAKVHSETRRYARRGDTVILIGTAGHYEAVGTLGEAPQQTVLVETLDDIANLDLTGPVSYVMQTTLAVDDTAIMVAALKKRFPGISQPNSDDICYATTNRQNAVRAVASDADVVLVVGSVNSHNSNRLVEVAGRHGTPAYLISDVSGIDWEGLRHAETVGLTAGASASPVLVNDVVDALRARGYGDVRERNVGDETMSFTLPREVISRPGSVPASPHR